MKGAGLREGLKRKARRRSRRRGLAVKARRRRSFGGGGGTPKNRAAQQGLRNTAGTYGWRLSDGVSKKIAFLSQDNPTNSLRSFLSLHER